MCGKEESLMAVDPDNNHFCYHCCGEIDKETMRTEGKIILYYDGNKLFNWPSTLIIIPIFTKKGKHNKAKTRFDIYFKFEDTNWHGIQYGSSSQLTYCKKLKHK
jgi:hypothetical protein